MPHSDALLSTYIWLVIFGVACILFFGIAVWVIIRGGKDVLEIITMSKKK